MSFIRPTLASATGGTDFSAMSAQDPLSGGGTWSNNTQGVGGNTAPTTATSMRLASATGGGPIIAVGSIAAQTNYEDSFAFLPGLATGGNYRVAGQLYVATGYAPVDNHEMELIIGCKTTSAPYHRWIECLWSIGANQQTINQDGAFDLAAVTDISVAVNNIGTPQDQDYFVAELYSSANRLRWGVIRSGVTTWAQDITRATYIDATLGTGMGIGAFRRAGDTNATSFGFRNFSVAAI